MRAGLSMLGIIIGVASVVIMIAIGDSAQKSIVSSVQSLGTNLLTISPGSQSASNVRAPWAGWNTTMVLTMDHVNAIESLTPYLSGVAPQVSSRKQVEFWANNTNTSITGVTPEYEEVHNFHIKTGQFLSDDDVTNATRVAVLGSTTANTLFGTASPIGQDITINGKWIFTVIGVMETKGSQGFTNTDDVVFIPISTAMDIITGVQNSHEYVSNISIEVADASKMDSTKTFIEALLDSMMGITKTSDENFTIQNQADALSAISSITTMLKLFLGWVAAISLIVGWIGVMNIMLVSVTERIREIGIRKAIGATRSDILLQFLMESIVLSLLGGSIGLWFSAGIIAILAYLNIFSASISSSSVLLSVGFSATIGIVFGILPAWKAGNLKPIDALRYE